MTRIVPAFTFKDLTRPALMLDDDGNIIISGEVADFVALYGIKALYLGLDGTPSTITPAAPPPQTTTPTTTTSATTTPQTTTPAATATMMKVVADAPPPVTTPPVITPPMTTALAVPTPPTSTQPKTLFDTPPSDMTPPVTTAPSGTGATLPPFAFQGIIRPELYLDAAGNIVLTPAALEFVAAYGLKALYLGVPFGTPFPPVPASPPSPPADADAAANSVAEGAAVNTPVGLTASSTTQTGLALNFSLTADSSGGGFKIDAATGVVSIADPSKIDFESSGASHAYSVTVRVSDGILASTRTFAIGVRNVAPSTPSDANAAGNSVAEGAAAGTLVGITASSTDVSGGAVSYSITADGSNGGFAIDTATGVVRVADPAKIDFESSGAGHAYAITVRASDGQLASTQNFTISVGNIAPTTPIDANAAADSVAEGATVNTAVGITASSTDLNGPAVTYSLMADTSNGGFKIDPATGVITVADSSRFDFESGGPNHSFSVTVQASDGTLSSSQIFTIAVTNVAPTTPIDVNVAANSVAEGAAVNTLVGVTASSSDLNGPAVAYSLIADSSGGGFKIDASTGVVTVADPTRIDFETAPGHSYEITVQSSDGQGGVSTQTFAIGVTDVAPTQPIDTIGPTGGTVAEGSTIGTLVGVTVGAIDINGAPLTYAFADLGGGVLGDAGGRFAINPSTGEISVTAFGVANIDFETAPGQSYDITVQASDGTLQSLTQSFAITVTNVAPSTPSDTDGNTANSVLEGAASGAYTGLTVASTDPGSAGSQVTYSLTDPAGGRFRIDAVTGAVYIDNASLIDYETASGHAYSITVQASDNAGGGNTLATSQTFSIAVANAPPSAPADGDTVNANSVTEGVGSGVYTGLTAVSTDPNSLSSQVTYSLIDNAGGRFTIESTTGRVLTGPNANLIDFETSGGTAVTDGSYSITVQASDGQGGLSTQMLTIKVLDAPPSSPVDVDAGADTVIEGTTAGTAVGVIARASDPNGGHVTYTFAPGGDANGAFAINATSGIITVADASKIDFESTAGAGHVYTLTVRGSDDSGQFTDQSFTVNVTNAPPSSPTSNGMTPVSGVIDGTVAEDASAGASAGITAQSTDVNGSPVTYSLSNNAGGLFAINPTTGEVTVIGAIDYESTTSAGHKYVITVDASDGTAVVSQNFTIGVTNVAPSPPTDVDGTPNRFLANAAEGSSVGVTLFATDPNGPAVTYSLTNDAGGLFQIDPDSGVVTLKPNHPTITVGTTYMITGTASDGFSTVSSGNIGIFAAGNQLTLDLDGNDSSGQGSGNNYSAAYTEQASAISIADGDAAISNPAVNPGNPGVGTATSATITLTNAQAGDVLSIAGALPGGINSTITAGAGTITVLLSGSSSYANYSAAIEQILFSNASDAPNTIARVITATVTDATGTSQPATTTISVSAVNDEPVLMLVGPANPVIYNENAGTTAFFTSGSLVDPDQPANFNGGSFTVEITSNAAIPEDLLVLRASSGFSVNGASVLFNGNTIGTVNGSTAIGTAKVTIDLTSAATPSVVNALVTAFGYRNASDNPSTQDRTVSFTFNDGGNTGSGSAKSSNVITQTVQVIAVNDAPTVTATSLSAIAEDTSAPAGSSVSALFAGHFSDPDGTLAGIAVSGNAANVSTQGVWEYSTDSGSNWFAIGSVSESAALKLNAASLLRFIPVPDYNGTPPSLTVYGLDNTVAGSFTDGNTTRTTINAVTHGGATAISVASTTIGIVVTPVNDAPVLTGATLAAVAEDTASPSGQTVATLFAGKVTDPDAAASLKGIAVAQNDASASEGVWEYFDGASWIGIGTAVGQSSALLLSASTLVRFVPAAQYNGTPGPLSVYGLDDTFDSAATPFTTSGSPQTIDLSTTAHGGVTPISASATTIGTSIAAVNDAPINTVPAGPLSIPQDSSFAITGLSIADVDANGGTETTTLTVSHGTLVVTLAGSATISGGGQNPAPSLIISGTIGDITATLASLVYTPDAGYSGPDVLTVLTNDGGNTGGAAQTDTDMVAITVRPLLDLDADNSTAPGTAFSALVPTAATGGSIAIVDTDVTIAPPTGQTVGTVVVTLTNAQMGDGFTVGSSLSLSGMLTLTSGNILDWEIVTIVGSPDQIVLTFTNEATSPGIPTSADYQEALGQVAFTYGTNPDTTDRAITVMVDTGATTATAASTVYFHTLDLDSVLNGTGYAGGTFTEGDATGIATAGATAITGFGTSTLSATVKITNVTAGDVLSFTDTALIQGNYTPGTGTLTLSAVVGQTPMAADFQAALQTVTYSNTSDNPNTTPRDISVVVSDGTASTNTAHAILNVSAVNDAPVAANGMASGDEDTVITGTVPAATDVDNTSAQITYHLDGVNGGALHGTVVITNAATGAYTYTPVLNYNGPDSFSYMANDGIVDSAGATINVIVGPVNDAPTIATTGPVSVTEDIASAVTGISFADVDDSTGAEIVTVTLGVASGSLAATTGSGVTVGGSSTALTLSGSLADINTFIAASSVKYTTAQDATANVTLNISIDDGGNTGSGGAQTASSSVILAVTAVNDAPVLDLNSADGSVLTGYTTTATSFGAAVAVAGPNVAISDVDNTMLVGAVVTLTNPNIGFDTLAQGGALPAGIGVVFSSPGDGTLVATLSGAASLASYQTALNRIVFSTSDPAANPLDRSVSIVVDDGQSANNLSIAATSTITVIGNQKPNAVADAAAAVEAGGVANGTPGTNPPPGNVLTNDTDDHDLASALVVSTVKVQGGASGTVGQALNGLYGTLTLGASGAYSYVVDNNKLAVQALRTSGDTLQDNFDYTARDTGGLESAPATLTITISGANDAPTAVADAVSATEAGTSAGVDPSGSGSGSVLANDTDPDAGDSKTVVGAGVGVTGTITGGTGVNSNLNNASASLNYGTFKVQSDGSYTYVVNQSNAAVQGLRTFAQTLTDTFSYTMRDTAGLTSTTQVTVTIHGQNDAPVAVADTSASAGAVAATEAGGTNNGSNATGNVLTNDTDPDSAVNGETTVVQGVAAGNTGSPVATGVASAIAGSFGALTLNSNGSYSYAVDNSNGTVQALNTNQTATDTFTYTIRDTAGATSTSTLTVTINGANDAPVAVNQGSAATPAYSAFDGVPVTINSALGLRAGASDVDNITSSLTAFRDTNPGHGTVTVNTDGSFTYTATSGYFGVDSFTYHVTDPGNLSSGSMRAYIDVQPRVAYIDNSSNAGTQDGTLANPFRSIAAFNAANTATNHYDIIYVEHGTGTYTATTGITLLAGQALLGQGVDLTYTRSDGASVFLNNFDNATGNIPTISVSSGNAVTLGTGNTIQGVNIANTGSGAGIIDNGGTVGTLSLAGVKITTGAGAGLSLTHGGTVTAAATTTTPNDSVVDVNSITSGTGTALNITNTTIGASGLIFHDISANGGTNGIVLNTTGSSGGLSVTGDGTTAGSGGTIQNTVQGAVLTSTSNVSLANMNFSNANSGEGTVNNVDNSTFNSAAQAAINLSNVSTVTLTNLNLNGNGGAGGSQFGINGQNVSNLTIANSTVTGFGDEVREGDVALYNLSGTSAFTNSNFSFRAGDTTGGENLVKIVNDTGTLTLNITGSTFSNTRDSSNGSSGLDITTVSNATLNLNVSNSSFLNLKSGGIDTIARGTSTNNINITNGNIFDPQAATGRAIGLSAQDTAHLNFNINNNAKLYGAGGPIVNIFTINSAVATGRIDNNSIMGVVTTATGGISVNTTDSSQGVVEIVGNTISKVYGIGVTGIANGTSSLDLTLASNNIGVTNNGQTGSAFRGATAAVFVSSTDTANAYSNIKSNAVTTEGTPFNNNDNGVATFGEGKTSHLYFENFQAGANNLVRANATWNGNGNTNSNTLNGPSVYVQDSSGAPAYAGIPGGHNGGHVITPSNPTALLSASGGVASASATSGETHLVQSQLDGIVAVAIAHWAAAGASAAQIALLQSVSYDVGDLMSGWLGASTPGHVTISANADGYGWFVDPTPNDNSEFAYAVSPTHLTADPTSAAAGHIDLLTTVLHEMGEQLGLDDQFAPESSDNLLYVQLAAGERRLPDAVDAARTVEASLPTSAQALPGTPIVVGTAGNDTIDAGQVDAHNDGVILFGGAGADTFVFGSGVQVGTPAQVTQVADYNAAQGDRFDFSGLTQIVHGPDFTDATTVRVIEDSSGAFATLQINTNAMGLKAGPTWAAIAQLDGAHAGDAVDVVLGVAANAHLAHIHVDLLM